MTIEKETKIQERLKSDFLYLTELGYNVLGIFLQGSQNYNLDYEGSDVDTKAIVIPSFKDFALNKSSVSTTLVLKDNSHLDVKDIRLIHDCFRKQNINFIEILFTRYKFINPEYENLYRPIFENNEKIAHYNNYAAVNCIAGMVYEKYKALEHPYPATIEKIKKYGFDSKQLHHMLRCEEFLNRYISGTPYAECLIPVNTQYLIKVKTECPYSLEEARKIAKKCENDVKAVKQNYVDSHPVVIDREVDKIMNEVLLDVLRYSFTKEL